MKNLILLLAVATMLSSACKKEETNQIDEGQIQDMAMMSRDMKAIDQSYQEDMTISLDMIVVLDFGIQERIYNWFEVELWWLTVRGHKTCGPEQKLREIATAFCQSKGYSGARLMDKSGMCGNSDGVFDMYQNVACLKP